MNIGDDLNTTITLLNAMCDGMNRTRENEFQCIRCRYLMYRSEESLEQHIEEFCDLFITTSITLA